MQISMTLSILTETTHHSFCAVNLVLPNQCLSFFLVAGCSPELPLFFLARESSIFGHAPVPSNHNDRKSLFIKNKLCIIT